MIITVDTNKDSPAQLKKAAEFILRLAGESYSAPTQSVDPSPGMMGMFGSEEVFEERIEEKRDPFDDDDSRIVPY